MEGKKKIIQKVEKSVKKKKTSQLINISQRNSRWYDLHKTKELGAMRKGW